MQYDKTFPEVEITVDLTQYSAAQRSTLKLYSFMDMQDSIEEALDLAVEAVSKDGSSNQFMNLGDH